MVNHGVLSYERKAYILYDPKDFRPIKSSLHASIDFGPSRDISGTDLHGVIDRGCWELKYMELFHVCFDHFL